MPNCLSLSFICSQHSNDSRLLACMCARPFLYSTLHTRLDPAGKNDCKILLFGPAHHMPMHPVLKLSHIYVQATEQRPPPDRAELCTLLGTRDTGSRCSADLARVVVCVQMVSHSVCPPCDRVAIMSGVPHLCYAPAKHRFIFIFSTVLTIAMC